MTAEDMVQESALKLWNGRNKIRNIDGFMKIVLRNICLDYLKSAATSRKDSLDENSNLSFADSISGEYEVKESIIQINRSIEKLPYNQQTVIKLRDIMGYKYCEIAEILSISEINTRVLLSRARKEIRKILLARNFTL